jgi:hypothetical protein
MSDSVSALTPQMVEAGEEVILEEVGGADLGGLFSAAGLAVKVYLAMCALDLPKRGQSIEHSLPT